MNGLIHLWAALGFSWLGFHLLLLQKESRLWKKIFLVGRKNSKDIMDPLNLIAFLSSYFDYPLEDLRALKERFFGCFQICQPLKAAHLFYEFQPDRVIIKQGRVILIFSQEKIPGGCDLFSEYLGIPVEFSLSSGARNS